MPRPIDLQNITLTGGYWFDKETLTRNVTLPALYSSYEKTGRVRSFELNWRQGESGEPHIFWDSDIAKWIEGASYLLITQRDEALEKIIDGLVAHMEAGQTPEGYFNVRYLTVEKYNRFTKRADHELYCAGHLMEAAVAYYRATGKDAMLRVMCRYADYIENVFVKHERPSDFLTPGHEEIELALVKLYETTGEERYLALAAFFIDRRGVSEAEKRHNAGWFGPEYAQDHLPVREQKTAEGHAVRALYLYAGMADIARLHNDAALKNACETLFENIVHKKMYVTGGLGGNYHGEAFSYEYDLPNELAYAETCASIAFVFFTQRMFLLTGHSKYMDAMEWMLYNAIPAGLSVSGDCFFYTNPLEMHPERRDHTLRRGRGQYAPEYTRPDDFGCSCCPPNVIRLFASIKGYMYHTDTENSRIYVNLYGSSVLEYDGLRITQTTHYPWDGAVHLTVTAQEPLRKVLYLRIPGYIGAQAAKNGASGFRCTMAGTDITYADGYAVIDRVWDGTEAIDVQIAMPVTEMYAHPSAHYNAGRVAIRRGPVVYCAEGADNHTFIKSAILKKNAGYRTQYHADLLGGVVVIDGEAAIPCGGGESLYSTEPPAYEDCLLRLIPYAVWANRGKNEMSVWLLKERAF